MRKRKFPTQTEDAGISTAAESEEKRPDASKTKKNKKNRPEKTIAAHSPSSDGDFFTKRPRLETKSSPAIELPEKKTGENSKKMAKVAGKRLKNGQVLNGDDDDDSDSDVPIDRQKQRDNRKMKQSSD